MISPSTIGKRPKRSRIAAATLMSLTSLGLAVSGTSAPALSAPVFHRITPRINASVTSFTTVTPVSADSFVNSVGVDSHFGMVNEPYVTQYSLIAPQLVASNIRHLRDAGTGTNYTSRMAYFYSFGITHSVSIPAGTSVSDIKAAIANGNGEVDAIEGPNEYDIVHHTEPNWTTTLKGMQNTLYRTVKNDPLGTNMYVLGPPLANAAYYSLLGNMDSMEDAGSLHESSCDYNPGTYHSDGVAMWLVAGRVSSPARPIWTTEAGYTTDLTRACSVPQDVAAKYDTRLIAQYWNDGGSRLYFYQLVDMPDDVMFGGKGLIDQYGNPKLQFTAISSLMHLLSDPGAAPAILPVSLSLSGQTANVETTLLQRRDGSYDLLIWQEVPSWDHDTRQRIAVLPQTVSITFPARPHFAHYWMYDATEHLSSQALPIVGTSVTLPVTDSISVLHFH